MSQASRQKIEGSTAASYYETVLKRIVAVLGSRSFHLTVRDAPAAVLEWIAAHPGQTALIVVNGVILFTPAALTSPLLASMGFGSAGPVAGSIAASVQAMFGNVVPGGIFATLQSAGMGGYGAAVVNGVVQASAGITGAFTYWWRGTSSENSRMCGNPGPVEEPNATSGSVLIEPVSRN